MLPAPPPTYYVCEGVVGCMCIFPKFSRQLASTPPNTRHLPDQLESRIGFLSCPSNSLSCPIPSTSSANSVMVGAPLTQSLHRQSLVTQDQGRLHGYGSTVRSQESLAPLLRKTP